MADGSSLTIGAKCPPIDLVSTNFCQCCHFVLSTPALSLKTDLPTRLPFPAKLASAPLLEFMLPVATIDISSPLPEDLFRDGRDELRLRCGRDGLPTGEPAKLPVDSPKALGVAPPPLFGLEPGEAVKALALVDRSVEP